MGIPEYWRFDDSGHRYHDKPPTDDRSVDGVFQPFPIERIDARTHQGYSTAPDLHLHWDDGRPDWYGLATGLHITSFRGEQDRGEARVYTRQEAHVPKFEARPRQQYQLT